MRNCAIIHPLHLELETAENMVHGKHIHAVEFSRTDDDPHATGDGSHAGDDCHEQRKKYAYNCQEINVCLPSDICIYSFTVVVRHQIKLPGLSVSVSVSDRHYSIVLLPTPCFLAYWVRGD